MSAPPELIEVAEAVAKELGLAAPAFCGNTVLPATLDAFRDYGRDHCVLPQTNPTLLRSAA